MKTLSTTKPKNEQNQKTLDKIMGEMSQYNENYLSQKQMSLSQMRMLTKKKLSVDQAPVKTGSQESQRNRVWKEENKDGHEKEEAVKLAVSKTEKGSLRASESNADQESEKKEKEHRTETEGNTEKTEAKPKKFNFNRNKAAS